jgi:hypothetical protein
MWVVPSIAAPGYPRVVQTRLVLLYLEEPRAGGVPGQPGLGQALARRQELEEQAPTNGLPTLTAQCECLLAV